MRPDGGYLNAGTVKTPYPEGEKDITGERPHHVLHRETLTWEMARPAGFEPATLRLRAGPNGVSRTLRDVAAPCWIELGSRQNRATSDLRFVPAFVAPKGQEKGNVETHGRSREVTAALIETPDRGGRRFLRPLAPPDARTAGSH
jgi:hypothetical protein